MQSRTPDAESMFGVTPDPPSPDMRCAAKARPPVV